MRRVCVFCGSNTGTDPAFAQAARQLGTLLAQQGIGLVYGGGGVGLMGVVAEAVLAQGGEVIGVIPEALKARELGHSRLAKLHVVGTMHERKALMASLADGFIAMPGGMGTLDEFCEIVTWAQLGIHAKPCGLLDVGGYFQHFLRFVDHAVDTGFVRADHRHLLLVEDAPGPLLERMGRYTPVKVTKWAGVEDV